MRRATAVAVSQNGDRFGGSPIRPAQANSIAFSGVHEPVTTEPQ